jgi:hypothetical protein
MNKAEVLLIEQMKAGSTVVLHRGSKGKQMKAVQYAKDQGLFVYIGREMIMYGKVIAEGSIWYNPFKIGKDGTREQVLEKFEDYLKSNAELIKQVKTLKGKALACWCSPEACHGDILKRYADSTE